NKWGRVVDVATSKASLAQYKDQLQEGTGLAGHIADKSKHYAETIPAMANAVDWLSYTRDSFDIEPADNFGNFDKFCDIFSKKPSKTEAQRIERRNAVSMSFTSDTAKLQFEMYRFDEQGEFKAGDFGAVGSRSRRRKDAGYRFKLLPGEPRFVIEE
ncbi:hypothetical protein THAOC_09215, partial [Thalassiosira oceanica]